ncbi:MAG: hypothetical protein BWY06_03159 [Candidatus Latescibacteria bacterium ADurb.Bin168]|nr:MAG: hypothetical protein BWY06_03159 [Candidatus Latescibacteria bacterium ADurb.Bin168]
MMSRFWLKERSIPRLTPVTTAIGTPVLARAASIAQRQQLDPNRSAITRTPDKPALSPAAWIISCRTISGDFPLLDMQTTSGI